MSVNYPIFDEIMSKYADQLYKVEGTGDDAKLVASIVFVEDHLTGDLEIHVPVGSIFQSNSIFKADLEKISSSHGVAVRHRVENKHRPKKDRENDVSDRSTISRKDN